MVLETETNTGLYIGRFQPLHLGHLGVLEKMDQDPSIGKIVIGIGGSQYKGYLDNPFSYKERREMIGRAFATKKPLTIVPIPDINDWPKWVSHVERLSPKFNVFYGGNEPVNKLFEESGYEVKRVKRQPDISATYLRHTMIQGGDWEKFVDLSTKDYIDKIKGVKNLQEKYRSHLHPVVTADMLIYYIDEHQEGLVLIRRLYPPFEGYWAFPGGHLNVGLESLEEAAVREAEEETNLKIDLKDTHLLGVYSKPQRDPRFHYISAVYYAEVTGGVLKAKDDAKEVKVFPLDKFPKIMAFDHRKIYEDFIRHIGYNDA